MRPLLDYARQQLPAVISLIRDLVEMESPSDNPQAVRRCLDYIVSAAADVATARFIDNNLLLAFGHAESDEGCLLLLGHADTVWDTGTLLRMPFKQAEGRLWGPGVLDMKAGIAFAIFAARALRDLKMQARKPCALLIVGDEEIGSPMSRRITEREARSSSAVLVLEPGTGLTGKLKTARKGIGHYAIEIHGRASHAGVDFENGASAIIEAAKQISRLAELTDLKRGITVNPGVIHGGTRSNVVAEHVRIEVDLRVLRSSDAEHMDAEIRALRPVDARCSLAIEGGLNRPPMERTAAIASLFEQARRIAADLGVDLQESSTGGGSDGNFTAALGIPTLDGLGAIGEGAHASHESILVDRIPDRVALLAGLMAAL